MSDITLEQVHLSVESVKDRLDALEWDNVAADDVLREVADIKSTVEEVERVLDYLPSDLDEALEVTLEEVVRSFEMRYLLVGDRGIRRGSLFALYR